MNSSKKAFEDRFSKTVVLLNEGKDQVFGASSVAVYFQGSTYCHWNGCGAHTLFDLASLTKPLVTTTLTAMCVDKKILKLDRALHDFFPEFKNTEVTLQHLLNHCAGFPAWKALYQTQSRNNTSRWDPSDTKTSAITEILQSFEKENFKTKCIYSDLGFLLLGWILESVTGSPLDALLQEWVIHEGGAQFGYKNLQFLPVSPDIVPTGTSPIRQRELRGEVNDENSFYLGGVTGHAGLFGCALEVLNLSKEWLLACQRALKITTTTLEDSTVAGLLKSSTVKDFWTQNFVRSSSRTLGWDSPSNDETSSAGKHMGKYTRGHLGFTGTSLWIDPEQDLIVVLLTNRVHLSKDPFDTAAIKKFRIHFHNTLLEELQT